MRGDYTLRRLVGWIPIRARQVLKEIGLFLFYWIVGIVVGLSLCLWNGLFNKEQAECDRQRFLKEIREKGEAPLKREDEQ